MSFEPLTSPVDHIVLAGRRSPGLAEVVDADTPRNFQERRGFGISFATLRFRGVSLAHFKVLLRLYTEQDWDDWHAWKDLVRRPTLESNPRRQAVPGLGPRLTSPPMTIEHPILADLEITDVVVENLVQPVQTRDGEWTIEIRFIEYRAPIVVLEQTQGAVARDADNQETVIAAQSRTIAELEAAGGLAGT